MLWKLFVTEKQKQIYNLDQHEDRDDLGLEVYLTDIYNTSDINRFSWKEWWNTFRVLGCWQVAWHQQSEVDWHLGNWPTLRHSQGVHLVHVYNWGCMWKVLGTYTYIPSCTHGKGYSHTCCLWKDLWRGPEWKQAINVSYRSCSRNQDGLWATTIDRSMHFLRRCCYIFILEPP